MLVINFVTEMHVLLSEKNIFSTVWQCHRNLVGGKFVCILNYRLIW